MTLENKVHFKKFLFISILPIIIFFLIGNLFFFYQYHVYTQNYNNKIASFLTLIEKEYPTIDRNELISILNREENVSEDIFHKYGIDLQEDSLIIENDKRFHGFLIIYNIIFACFLFTLLFLYVNYEKKQDKEIKKIVKYIEEIYKKNYSINIDENSEDELSILKNELYKITIMLKEDAENSKKDKHKLKDSLSDISHQLKTPLTSINIMLDNILDNPDMDKKTKEQFIQKIKREIMNISSLVEDLLKLSKFDVNVVKFEEHEVPINNLISKAINNVEMIAELKNINIKVENHNEDKILCDEKWQVEAITNLLKNCIEHSKENSTILIKTSSNKIYKSIEITDHGEGISEKDLPHIFERFYKGQNASKDSVGIGLALAKTMIEKNNGSITVDSKKGKQTTFRIKYFK